MRRLRSFLRRPLAYYVLVGRAGLWLGLVVVGLRLVGFRPLGAWIRRLSPSHVAVNSGVRLAWAVSVASRYVPGAAVCLPRALATQALLLRSGHPACLHIG